MRAVPVLGMLIGLLVQKPAPVRPLLIQQWTLQLHVFRLLVEVKWLLVLDWMPSDAPRPGLLLLLLLLLCLPPQAHQLYPWQAG